MTSKEALERLFGSYIRSKCYGINYQQDEKDYNIIKQDLDRLEMLEELNKINREIRSIATEAVLENSKLKKAIEILKDELGLYLEKIKFDRRKIFSLMSKLLGMCLLNTTEENYDLLKEVLGNE